MTLTRDELASGLEDRKYNLGFTKRSLTQILYGEISGITKGLTLAEGVPALTLTFLVMGIPREEYIQGSDKFSAVGKLESAERG